MSVYDVVIVGTGISGLFTALNLKSDLNVLLITNRKIKASNSYLAQGGISVMLDESDFGSFTYDTMNAGQFENNENIVKCMVKNSRDAIKDLINFSVDFQSDENGFKYTKEGAHSKNRVLHHKDITGKEIIDKLVLEVRKRSNIRIVEGVKVVNILNEKNMCMGVTAICGDELFNIPAKIVVFATGGVGGMFDNTTNFKHIKGDGVNIALNKGINCEKLSYIQIHPTSLFLGSKGRRFLISETLRGEGAYILNSKGERFVDELLPRDIVSNAIFNEMDKTRQACVYLSFNHKGVEFVKERFPSIYKKCKKVGYELGIDSIPVTPAVHYFMGGIKIDDLGRTNFENFYAVGETACLNVHGKNRLASNALLEGIVFSKRTAKHINSRNLDEISDFNCDIRCYKNTADTKFKNIIKEDNIEFYNKWFL